SILAKQQGQRKGNAAGQDSLGWNTDAEHRLEELSASRHAPQVGPHAANGGKQTLFRMKAPDALWDHEDAVQQGHETERTAGYKPPHGMKVPDQHRAHGHPGDHASLEAEHDDGIGLRLPFRRGYGEDVGLDADEQHSLADSRQAAQDGHGKNADWECQPGY